MKNNNPWLPTNYVAADVSAIQALERGEATPDQQKRALNWIIVHAAKTYDQSYRPGTEGQRDTDFAEGKRYVGNEIVKMLKLEPGKLRREENV